MDVHGTMIAETIEKGVAVGPTVEGMSPPQEVKLRPNVARHFEYFQGCVEKHGADMVRGVLSSKDGRYKGGRLHFTLSNKDKYQLLQVLGLLNKGVADGAA